MTALKAMIRDWGESQTALASKFGVTMVHLNMIVNGNSAPSLELAFRIGEHFHQSVHSFWELTEVGIVARDPENRRRKGRRV